MRKRQNSFPLRHLLSAVLMLVALAWLTVSLPFVAKAQQDYKAFCQQAGKADADDDNSNPLSNTNEEKTESGVSLLSEYLHETPVLERHFITLSTAHVCHPSDLYLAYHPEMIIPPPDKA